jgi:hypothetical protein
MSNPLINRWGLNLFWYNFWYQDKNTSFSFNFDKIVQNFIYLYLNFGLILTKNFFFFKYWYQKTIEKKNIIFQLNNYKYFRILEHKNRITGEITPFYVRIKKKNIYFTKLWILKYQNWLILSVLAYKPFQKKKNILKKKVKEKSFVFEELPEKFNKNLLLIFRLKLKLTFLFNNFINSSFSYYRF